MPGIIPVSADSRQYDLSCDANGPGAGAYIIYQTSDCKASQLTIVYEDEYMSQNTSVLQGEKVSPSSDNCKGPWKWDVTNYRVGCKLQT